MADEIEKPRESLPNVVRRIPERIVMYYVLAVLALGISVSANDPILQLPASGGPVRNYPGGFVVMAERTGNPFLPHIINVIMMIAVFSTATAEIYMTVFSISFSTEFIESLLTGTGRSKSSPPYLQARRYISSVHAEWGRRGRREAG